MMTTTSAASARAKARTGRPLSLLTLDTVAGLTDRPVCSPTLADDLGMGALLRFKAMMGAEGQSVHVARMCYDRLYAYERIACAHASARDTLRRLALELFQAYHRRDEVRGLSA